MAFPFGEGFMVHRIALGLAVLALGACATRPSPAAQAAVTSHCEAQGYHDGPQMSACVKQMEEMLRRAKRVSLR
jgi:hypothetical protein